MNTREPSARKTIFEYVTDNSMYVNKSECFDSTPPFVSYIPIGVPTKNVDIETELRGANRIWSRSKENKYYPESLNTVQSLDNKPIQNLNECKENQKIINNYVHNTNISNK